MGSTGEREEGGGGKGRVCKEWRGGGIQGTERERDHQNPLNVIAEKNG